MKGQELRRLRLRMGLTQKQLGAEVGVAENTIARWERGEMKINEPAAKLMTILAKGARPAEKK